MRARDWVWLTPVGPTAERDSTPAQLWPDCQTVSRAPGLQLQVPGSTPGHDGQLEVSLPSLRGEAGREGDQPELQGKTAEKTDNSRRTPSPSIRF